MANLDALVRLAEEGLAPFAEAVFATESWPKTMTALGARSDWPPRATRLLARSGVADCEESYLPKDRCVLEMLLAGLGATGTPEAIATLTTIAARHPQRELRLYAVHGLLSAGPLGIDAAAGPPGQPPSEADLVVSRLRAKAAILRGDAPDAAASIERKSALLDALHGDFRYDKATSKYVGADGLMGRHPGWLPFVVDSLFEPALANLASSVLSFLPNERWKPLRDARKRGMKPAKNLKPPTKIALRALDIELTRTRDALEVVVADLRAEGFAFEGEPLSPPARGYTKKLRVLEKQIGVVPAALARFWAIVGAVDLRGNHPGWSRRTYVSSGDEPHWLSDPLVVTSLDAALAEAHESDFDVAEAPEALRYELDIAGDATTKANFSGGAVFVRTPSATLDAELVGRKGTFLELLREAVEWRGFPGFAEVADAPVKPLVARRPSR